MKTFQQLILQYSHSVILLFFRFDRILRRLKMPYADITLLRAIFSRSIALRFSLSLGYSLC